MTDIARLVSLRLAEVVDAIWVTVAGVNRSRLVRHIARLLLARTSSIVGVTPLDVAVGLPASEYDLVDGDDLTQAQELAGAVAARLARARPEGRDPAVTIVLLPLGDPAYSVDADDGRVRVSDLDRVDALVVSTEHEVAAATHADVTSPRWALVPAGPEPGDAIIVTRTCYLGRGVQGPGRLDHRTVSKVHARLEVAGSRLRIEDLGSLNGTVVRGDRIDHVADVRDGDEVRVGAVRFRATADAAPYIETL